MKWNFVRFAGNYAAGSLIFGLLLLLQVLPWHPRTLVGWPIFVSAALPLAVAGEWLGDVILENRFAQ